MARVAACMCVAAAVCSTPYLSSGVCMFGHSPLRWFGVQRGFYIYLLDPEREPGYKQMVLAAARVSVGSLEQCICANEAACKC